MDEENNVNDTTQDELTNQENRIPSGPAGRKIRREAKKFARNKSKKARRKAVNVLFKPVGISVFSGVLSVFIVIFMMIGIISFITSMPGMVQEKIYEKVMEAVSSLKYMVNGSDYYLNELANDPNHTAQKEVLKYLDDMGLDPVGLGFAAFYERYTDENGNEVIDYTPNYEDEVTMEDYAYYEENEQSLGLFTDWVNAKLYNLDSVKQLIEKDLIFKYVVANERTYLVHDLDKAGNTSVFQKFKDEFGINLKGMIVTQIEGWDDSEITVDRDNKQMVISSKNGLSTQTFTYNLDGWTGRYGTPLEFLLALHIGTMTSDLTDEMLSNENLQTEVRVTSVKDNYDVEYNVTYKGEKLPIGYKPANSLKGSSAYSDLNDFMAEHLKYDFTDGRLYLDATEDEILDIKEKDLISLNSLITLIQNVKYFSYGYDQTQVDINALRTYGLEGRKALFGDDMYRVQYVMVAPAPSRGNDQSLYADSAWFGPVKMTSDGKYSVEFPEKFGLKLHEELENDGGAIYEAEDGQGWVVVSNETESPIYLNSPELYDDDSSDKYRSGSISPSSYTTTAIIHGFGYYLEDDSKLELLRDEDTKIAIACMLSQQDSQLYEIYGERGVPLNNTFVPYTHNESIMILWNNEIEVNDVGNDTLYLYTAHEWIDFWTRTNQNPTNQQLREELEKIKTMLQEAYDAVDNTDVDLQNVIDQILMVAYGTSFDINDLILIESILSNQNADVEFVQPRIAYVIKHWYKDILFDGVYKDTGAPIVIELETGNEDLYVTATLTNGSNYTQTGEPYVVKGDLVTLDGKEVNYTPADIEDSETPGKFYTPGDGYRTTKKLFTQGQYYVYDGSKETAKSIAYAKELEDKLDGTNNQFAKVHVKNGRISLVKIYNSKSDALSDFGDAYDDSTGEWNVNAQEVNNGRINENLGDVVQYGKGTYGNNTQSWSVFYAKATYSHQTGDKLDVYYIKTDQSLEYISPATYSVGLSKKSVNTINSILSAMGVVTQRKPVSFDNTTAAGDVVALTAFSILESAHSEDAEYVYRDLKEFLIELGYYTKAEFEYIETKVLTWFIPGYMPTSSENLSAWRQNTDEDALEYGAIIYPEIKDTNGDIIQEGFASGLEVIAPGNFKILKLETDAKTNISTITVEFDGISEPEIGMLNGYTMIIKGFELNEDAIKVQNELGVESELSIGQIVNSDITYIVPVGTVIGYTSDAKIQVILKDSKGAFVENIEDYMGPELATVSSDSTEFSVVGTVLTETEFVQCCQSYMSNNGIVNADFSESNLKEFYRICKSKGVNPELAFVTAVTESSLTAYEATSTHNYWGLNTPNGSAVPALGTMLETLELYCDRIVEYQNPYGGSYQMIMERYEERSTCTENGGCNPNGYGKPNTLQGLQSIYSYVGDHVQGGSGTGGYYYLDPGVAGFTGVYSSHEEFVNKCQNVHAAGSKATVWEQAQYTAWQVESKIEKAKSIFGENAGKFVY